MTREMYPDHRTILQKDIGELRLEPMERLRAPSAPTQEVQTGSRRQSALEGDELRDVPESRSGLRVTAATGTGISCAIITILAAAGYWWWASTPMRPDPNPTAAALSLTNAPVAASKETDDRALDVSTEHTSSEYHPQQSGGSNEIAVNKDGDLDVTMKASERQQAKNVQSEQRQPMASPDSYLRFESSSSANNNEHKVSLVRAYDAYQHGDYDAARIRYREVLGTDPNDIDALVALGSIALHDAQPDVATGLFRKAITADPENTTARSLLTLMQADADMGLAENTVRTQLRLHPDSAPLQFTLGTLLARQGHWDKAQQAFFQAYTLDSANPDVLYNLAVSLDHLRQPALASHYYQAAIKAADQRPAAFDRILAANRASTLAEVR